MKKIYLIFLFIILSSSVKSQWVPDNLSHISNSYASFSKSVAVSNNLVDDDNSNLMDINIDSGLIAYYPFENNANDYSGNNHHGSFQNSAYITSGIIGNGVQITENQFIYGNGGYVLLPPSLTNELNNLSNFTISMWVKEEYINHFHGNAYIFLGDYTYGWAGIGHFVYILDNSQNINFSSGSIGNEPRIRIPFENNFVQHFVLYTMAYINGQLKAYINGNFVGEIFQPININGTNAALGKDWWDNGGIWGTRLQGVIDDVRIYDRALSQSEIQQLYIQASSISVIIPNGGETIYPGLIKNITWASEAIHSIKIELSTNNGNSWSLITSNYPADSGRYSWTVPSISSSQCKIKISDANDPSLYDVSDSNFTIIPVTLNTGLMAYYPLDGNTIDHSGNGNNASEIFGGVTFENGKIGQAAKFRGYNNPGHIKIPNSSTLQFNNQLTISYWTTVDSYTTGENFCAFAKDHDRSGFISTHSANMNGSFGSGFSNNYFSSPRFDISPPTTISNYTLGKWIHITYVVDVNIGRLYINGALFHSISAINVDFSIANSRDLYLGKFSDAWYPYNGKIDEFRIYNRVLSSVEIQNLYAQGVNFTLTMPNGGESWQSGTSKEITWNPGEVNSLRLEFTSNNGSTWSTLSANYPAVSGRFAWTVPNVNSTQCKIKISDANNPSLYDVSDSNFTISPVTLNTGLIAYYPFNGNVNDESGNNNHGVNSGASLTADVNGNLNKAYYFNGLNNFISIPDFSLLNLNNVTVHCQIFPQNLNSIAVYHGYYGELYISAYQNQIWFGVKLGDNNWYSCIANAPIEQWYTVSGTWVKGNKMKIYINGQFINETNVPNLDLYEEHFHSSSIGAYNRLEALPFLGKIDGVRFYNRALSQSEIQQLYNQESQIVINTPSISISPIQINPGGSISISGQNFRASAQVKVNVISSNSQTVLDQTYTTNSAGGFNANYSSNVNSSPGIYTVSAYDIVTSQSAPNKIFEVTEPPETFDLTLTSPNSDTVDRIIDVEWRDKMIPMSGYSIVNIKRYYKYKINFTTDNGTNWSSDIYSEGFEFINSTPVFSKQISLPPLNSIQVGTVIKFKVTDYISTSRYSESQNIHIRNSELTKSNISLVWDFSYPNPNRAPKGVSADGVSRFYLKISKNSGSPAISSVTIHLTDDKINTDIKYLGKLKIATITNDFSTEADNANLIQISNSGQIDYWFWYVSPDDFVRAGADDELKNQRTVTANVKVNYSDATTEYGNQNILIARPPLMFLHGIGSNGYLWNDYSINFIRLFKVIETPSYNSAYGFRDIGNALLNWNNENPYNPLSFQNAVYKMRNAGFATNQVYYISHSMGGNIARAASEIPYYNSKQNYYKGHINRLITMDTPNNGSPIADFVIYTLPLINNLEKFTKWGEVTKLAIKGIIKSRLVDLLNSTLKLEENSVFSDISPTASLKNLQISGNGSYKFRITPIKSFLFAGDFFPGENIIFSNTNYNIIGKGGFNKLFEYLEKVIQITLYPNLINLFYSNEDKQSALNIFKKRSVSVSEKVTKILELVYKKIFNSNSSIFNSDLIVSVNSQLANTPRTYANTYDSFNGDYGRFFGISHTNILSNPCTKDTLIRSKIKNLISLPLSYNEFLQTIPLTPSNSINNPFEYSDNFTSNSFDTTKVLNILFPEEGHLCIVDSIVNISFNINDTTDLQYVNISFQGENYYDTVKSLSYSFNLNVNSNELDSSYIQVSAVYLKNDSLIVSEDLKKVVIKTLSNPIEFEVSGNFFELFKGDIIFPTYKTVYPGFIHNGNTKDIAAIVDNTSIIVFDNISKSFKAISTGETFAIVSNGVHSDTIYFNVIGEILVPGNTDLVYPVDQAFVPSSDLKLSWNIVDYASQYNLQIAEDINFENIVFRNSNINDTVTTASDIRDSVRYYWRVKAINSAGSGNWSSVRSFITYPLFNAHFYITVIPQGFYNESTNSLRRKDTVKAYLMNINSPYNIIDSASSVIDSISHQGLFNFINETNGTYYLKLIHRNSIETWSKTGGEVFTKYSTMNFDFTSSQSQAFGSNLIQIESAWCIYSGDVNQDEVIDASDMSEVDNDAYNSVSGYVRTDITGDDFVDAADMSIVDNNAYNAISVIRP